jgi:hypothetical protein
MEISLEERMTTLAVAEIARTDPPLFEKFRNGEIPLKAILRAAKRNANMKTSYETSPVRERRTPAQLESLLSAIQEILQGEDGQITIRHLFYRLIGLSVIPKTEAAYKNLCGHLSKWRRDGQISWAAFSDSTRWHIQQKTFDGIQDALKNTVETYRRNLWATQKFYCEVWVEKDAMAGIVSDVANSFGVPVFVCRGFASLSSLYNAAQTFKQAIEAGKKVAIYHLGDYDPSGIAAGDAIQNTFQKDFGVNVTFNRLAVTPFEINCLNLPTRPVKRSDTRAAKWGDDGCVELDTMPPAEIRRLIQDTLTGLIEPHQWKALQKTEAMELATLKKIQQSFKG